MSDARTMKMKEYGTDVLSHNPHAVESSSNARSNNTFKSSIMDQTPDINNNKAKSRERIFSSRPLVSQVQRASYQDSNIFGYKDQGSETIQPVA